MSDGPSPAQLSRVLRFHLNELGALNAHHEFEHLARHIARARLYSNILPATGPVSAGGDGGRDFESFRTTICHPLTAGSTFAKNASGTLEVVFACSLEKKIEPKIRKDVMTIVADGPVDEIIYFCEADFPIGRRRRLQKWARETHGVELRIFDGQAIAEWLSDRDLFWIAQQYLSLPADLGPSGPAAGDGYDERRQRWRNRTPLVISRADFADIKTGLRRATFDLMARHDLLFWLGTMDAFATSDEAPRSLTRKAHYEIAVAALRGLGDMTPQSHRLRDYFSDMTEWLGIADLQDAATLLVYAFGGILHSTYHGPVEELAGWRNSLLTLIDSEIAAAPGAVRRTGLLRVRGHISGLPDSADGPNDTSASLADWSQMLDEAKTTPLFPIEDFADFLTKVIGIAGENPGLLDLAARADELVAERAGGGVAGEKALKRALALLDHDHALAAIRELHRAKTRWFSGDRIAGAVRVMLLLADSYRNLGLVYAAKNYALAAAFIAEHHPQDGLSEILPAARLAVADLEDGSGSAIGFIQSMSAALQAHVEHEPDPLDLTKHQELNINIGQLATWRGALRRLAPAALPAFDTVYSQWPPILWDPIKVASDDPKGFWMGGSPDDLWASLQDAVLDRPFNDFGPERRIGWRAMDITWTCVFENRYAVTPEAEQLIAHLQLFSVILLRADLVIPAGEVRLDITVDPTAKEAAFAEADSRPLSSGLRFQVTLPPGGPPDSWSILTTVLAPLLGCLSLLPMEAAAKAVGDHAEALAGELFTARPYAEMYRDLVSEEMFNEPIRLLLSPVAPERPFEHRVIPALASPDDPGPGYHPDKALASIEQRYERAGAHLRYTLPAIVKDPGVKARLESMRSDGLKDWEILSILANVALNARFVSRFQQEAPATMVEAASAELNRPEELNEALPPEVFTDDALEMNRQMFLRAHVNSWGLQSGRYRDFGALEALLIRRYGLRHDDVDHEPFF